MAERVTRVRLSALTADYVKAMDRATEATKRTEGEAQKLRREANELKQQADDLRAAYDTFGKISVVAGAAITAGLGVAVKKASDFNQAMSYVKATGQDAVENFDALRQAALDAGADTVYSASESANAIEEMAKAGVDATDILGGGLTGALDLAAAGGLDVADAAGYAAIAMKTFNLEGDQMSHVADLLAAGAGKAMGDVDDLGSALAQAGLVSNSTGLSIEETTAALAAFASQGLIGSDAGTSFKSMLQRLTPQGKPAREMFEELGISAYDAQGQFIGLAEFAGNLQTAMADMTPEARNAALTVMFGSDAIRAANVLYAEGEQGIRDWTTAVDDQGYAAEVAATRLDNLAGDVEGFGGAMDTALISIGDTLDGPLRGLVQWATSVVDGFNELPGPAKEAATWIGVATGAIALLGGGALLAIPQIAKFKAAVETMGWSMRGLKIAGTIGLGAIGVLVTALAALPALFNDGSEAAQAYADTLDDAGKKTEATAQLIDDTLATKRKGGLFNLFENDSILEEADGLGLSLTKIRDAAQGNTEAMAELNAELDSYWTHGLNSTVTDAGREVMEKQGISLDELVDRTNNLKSGLDDVNKSTEEGTALKKLAIQSAEEQAEADAEVAREQANAEAATKANNDALDAMSGAAQDATQDLDKLADTIRNFGSAQLDVRGTQRDFEAAIDDLTQSLEDNGETLDVGTEKGRANSEALDDLADKTLQYAAAAVIADGNTEHATAIMEKGRDKYVEMAEAMGMSHDEAEALADELELLPENLETSYELTGVEEVKQQIADVQAAMSSVSGVMNWMMPNTLVPVMDLGGSKTDKNYSGGVYQYGIKQHASGQDYPSGIYPGVRGGLIMFAEDHKGVPWETFISGRPQDREKNIGIWGETGHRLGVLGQPTAGNSITTNNAAPAIGNVNQTINAAPGMSPGQVGDIASQKLAFYIGG